VKKFYVGLKEQLLIIKETEDGYEFSTHLKGHKANRLALDPRNEARKFVATDDGLWKTEDDGAHWEQADDGIDSKKITAVAANPRKQANGNTIFYAGTEPSALYYSEDNGKSWTEFIGIQELPSKRNWAFPPRPETHFVRWITPAFGAEDYIAVSIEAGAIIYTNDHGKTWNDRAEDSPVDTHTLLKHPDAPARLYAANGDGGYADSKKGYAESHDGGQSWTHMGEGLGEHGYLYNMVLHPNNPDERLVSASTSAKTAHNPEGYATVYRKMGEEPFEKIADGLPTEGSYTHHLANDPNHVDAYYAFNNFGLFWLGPETDTWEKVDLDWPEEYKDERPYFFVVREENI